MQGRGLSSVRIASSAENGRLLATGAPRAGLGWGAPSRAACWQLEVASPEEELHPGEPLATSAVLQQMGNPDPPLSHPFDLPNTQLPRWGASTGLGVWSPSV